MPSVVWLVLVAAMGCHSSDVGTPCPALLQGQNPITTTNDDTLSNTQEVVEQDPTFPCKDLICVASEGSSGYCSAKCLDAAGCPAGFDCRIIQMTGDFRNTKLCAWKQCTQRQDCGNAHDFCCVHTAGANPNQEYGLCSFSDNGKCP